MPTQEERLTALERSQIDTNKNMTIVLGIVAEQGRDIKRIAATLEQHSELLQKILDRLPAQK